MAAGPAHIGFSSWVKPNSREKLRYSWAVGLGAS